MTDDTATGSQIYLVIEAGISAASRLDAALQAAPIASVLVTPAGDQPLVAEMVHPLVAQIQDAGAAALLANDANLARALRADGVHLSASNDILHRYEEAREILGNQHVVGAHAGKSRHVAMLLAEANAEYIAFGAPDFAKDRAAAKARRHDLVAWWSEIFEIPCVAMDVTTPEEAADLTAAGADFIAVTIPGATADADIARHILAVSESIRNARDNEPTS